MNRLLYAPNVVQPFDESSIPPVLSSKAVDSTKLTILRTLRPTIPTIPNRPHPRQQAPARAKRVSPARAQRPHQLLSAAVQAKVVEARLQQMPHNSYYVSLYTNVNHPMSRTQGLVSHPHAARGQEVDTRGRLTAARLSRIYQERQEARTSPECFSRRYSPR